MTGWSGETPRARNGFRNFFSSDWRVTIRPRFPDETPTGLRSSPIAGRPAWSRFEERARPVPWRRRPPDGPVPVGRGRVDGTNGPGNLRRSLFRVDRLDAWRPLGQDPGHEEALRDRETVRDQGADAADPPGRRRSADAGRVAACTDGALRTGGEDFGSGRRTDAGPGPTVGRAADRGYYLGKEESHVGRAFQPDDAAPSGWKARPTFLPAL